MEQQKEGETQLRKTDRFTQEGTQAGREYPRKRKTRECMPNGKLEQRTNDEQEEEKGKERTGERRHNHGYMAQTPHVMPHPFHVHVHMYHPSHIYQVRKLDQFKCAWGPVVRSL